jgi:hypothetical protein
MHNPTCSLAAYAQETRTGREDDGCKDRPGGRLGARSTATASEPFCLGGAARLAAPPNS